MSGPGEELQGLRVFFDSSDAIAGVARWEGAMDSSAARTEAGARRIVTGLGTIEPAAQRVGAAGGKIETTAQQIERSFSGITTAATKSARESAGVFEKAAVSGALAKPQLNAMGDAMGRVQTEALRINTALDVAGRGGFKTVATASKGVREEMDALVTLQRAGQPIVGGFEAGMAKLAVRLKEVQAVPSALNLTKIAGALGQVSPLASEAVGALGGMASAIGPLAGVAAGAVALGLAAKETATFLKEASAEARESEVAYQRLGFAVGASGENWSFARGSVEGYLDTLQRTTRFSDEQAADTFSKLLFVTQDYGAALKALPVVLDFAAAAHVDSETAARVLGLAMEGNTQLLRRYGVTLDEGTKAILKISTQSEAAAIVTAKIGAVYRGFAERDAKTLQGQLDLLGNQWRELKEQVGGAENELIVSSGVVKNLTDSLAGVVRGARDLKEAMPEGLGKLLVPGSLDNAFLLLDGVANRLHYIADIASKIKPVVLGTIEGATGAKLPTPELPEAPPTSLEIAAKNETQAIADLNDVMAKQGFTNYSAAADEARKTVDNLKETLHHLDQEIRSASNTDAIDKATKTLEEARARLSGIPRSGPFFDEATLKKAEAEVDTLAAALAKAKSESVFEIKITGTKIVDLTQKLRDAEERVRVLRQVENQPELFSAAMASQAVAVQRAKDKITDLATAHKADIEPAGGLAAKNIELARALRALGVDVTLARVLGITPYGESILSLSEKIKDLKRRSEEGGVAAEFYAAQLRKAQEEMTLLLQPGRAAVTLAGFKFADADLATLQAARTALLGFKDGIAPIGGVSTALADLDLKISDLSDDAARLKDLGIPSAVKATADLNRKIEELNILRHEGVIETDQYDDALKKALREEAAVNTEAGRFAASLGLHLWANDAADVATDLFRVNALLSDGRISLADYLEKFNELAKKANELRLAPLAPAPAALQRGAIAQPGAPGTTPTLINPQAEAQARIVASGGAVKTALDQARLAAVEYNSILEETGQSAIAFATAQDMVGKSLSAVAQSAQALIAHGQTFNETQGRQIIQTGQLAAETTHFSGTASDAAIAEDFLINRSLTITALMPEQAAAFRTATGALAGQAATSVQASKNMQALASVESAVAAAQGALASSSSQAAQGWAKGLAVALAVIAGIKMYYEIAEGIAADASYNYTGAAMHYAAAAQYGIVSTMQTASSFGALGGGSSAGTSAGGGGRNATRPNESAPVSHTPAHAQHGDIVPEWDWSRRAQVATAQAGHTVPDTGAFGDRHPYLLERGEAVLPRSLTRDLLAGRATLAGPSARDLAHAAMPDVMKASPVLGGRLLSFPTGAAKRAQLGDIVPGGGFSISPATERTVRGAVGGAGFELVTSMRELSAVTSQAKQQARAVVSEFDRPLPTHRALNPAGPPNPSAPPVEHHHHYEIRAEIHALDASGFKDILKRPENQDALARVVAEKIRRAG